MAFLHLPAVVLPPFQASSTADEDSTDRGEDDPETNGDGRTKDDPLSVSDRLIAHGLNLERVRSLRERLRRSAEQLRSSVQALGEEAGELGESAAEADRVHGEARNARDFVRTAKK